MGQNIQEHIFAHLRRELMESAAIYSGATEVGCFILAQLQISAWTLRPMKNVHFIEKIKNGHNSIIV